MKRSTTPIDERARMLFYGLDLEELLTGTWKGKAYEALPDHVIQALYRVVIATCEIE